MAPSSPSPRRHSPAKFVAIICSVVINLAQSFSYYFPGVGEAVLRESGQVEHVHVLRHRVGRYYEYLNYRPPQPNEETSIPCWVL